MNTDLLSSILTPAVLLTVVIMALWLSLRRSSPPWVSWLLLAVLAAGIVVTVLVAIAVIWSVLS